MAQSRKTVLIAVDAPGLGDALAYNLTRHGHRVIVIHSTADELLQACKFAPDLIVFEEPFSFTAGQEVYRGLRSMPEIAKIPCLMLVDHEGGVENIGSIERLAKPFTLKEFFRKVETLLQPREGLAMSSEPATSGKYVVLFLCTANAARSQMAEAFLKRYAAAQFDVYSAGFQPKDIHPFTRDVMGEIGFDLNGQRSKGVGEYLGKIKVHQAVIVCQDSESSCPSTWPQAWSLTRWPFEDPAASEGDRVEQLTKFRLIRDQIDERIRGWLRGVGIQPPDPIPRPTPSPN